jgi:hypothetical protein
MRRSQKVWLGIAAVVLAHNSTAEDGDTLSEMADEWVLAYPVLTRAVIAMFALHLANAIYARYDPVHLAFTVTRTWRRRRVVVVVQSAPA